MKIINHKMKLNRLTLQFSGESSLLEQPFLKKYYESSIPYIQTIMVLGCILYAAFGILDALLVPEQMFTFWIIRLIIISQGLACVFLISFSDTF
jgi:hypothetical protein